MRKIVSLILVFFAVNTAYSQANCEFFLLRLKQYEGSAFTSTEFDGHFTKYGIIESTLKKWFAKTGKGDKDKDGKVTWNDVRLLTWEDAVSIYRNEYWNPARADEIKSQKVANVIVDFFVNSGFRKDFINEIQRIGGRNQIGRMDSLTVALLNKQETCKSFNSIIDWRYRYMERICRAEPKRLGKLRVGLINRVLKNCINENYKNNILSSDGCNCLTTFQLYLQEKRKKPVAKLGFFNYGKNRFYGFAKILHSESRNERHIGYQSGIRWCRGCYGQRCLSQQT
jgi:hypothetical protein